MKNARKQKGFTVVEVIIVIIVIAILAAITLVSINNVQQGARDKTLESKVTQVMGALERFKAENSRYPTSDELNPTLAPEKITNFGPAASKLKLDTSVFTGPGNSNFYVYCESACNSGTNGERWNAFRVDQFIYVAIHDSTTAGGTVSVSIPSTWDRGWGCTVSISYNDPSYAIAWYSEGLKKWVFKKGGRGNATITNRSSQGPVSPQTCTFS